MQVNVAIGYGGRQEIADAVRSLLYEHAAAGTTIILVSHFLEEVLSVADGQRLVVFQAADGSPARDGLALLAVQC